jgi:glycosyltransferase involved in cell wall biosynthesis
MAMECPLVTTTIGAEGLPVEHDRHLLIADGAEAFANAVLELLQDPERARHMGLISAEWVRENYGWERAATEFARLLEPMG